MTTGEATILSLIFCVYGPICGQLTLASQSQIWGDASGVPSFSKIRVQQHTIIITVFRKKQRRGRSNWLRSWEFFLRDNTFQLFWGKCPLAHACGRRWSRVYSTFETIICRIAETESIKVSFYIAFAFSYSRNLSILWPIEGYGKAAASNTAWTTVSITYTRNCEKRLWVTDIIRVMLNDVEYQ